MYVCVCECLCACMYAHWQDEIAYSELEVGLITVWVLWLSRRYQADDPTFLGHDCGSQMGQKGLPHRKMRKHSCKPQQPAGVQWDGERRDAWARSHWSFVISSQGKLPSRMCEGHKVFVLELGWQLLCIGSITGRIPCFRSIMIKSLCSVAYIILYTSSPFVKSSCCCFFQVLLSLSPRSWVEILKLFYPLTSASTFCRSRKASKDKPFKNLHFSSYIHQITQQAWQSYLQH